MNHEEILKSILPELSMEEINELTQSIERRASEPVKPTESNEEKEDTAQTQILDFNKIVNSKEAFFSIALRLGEDKRHERIYKRVFDKERDSNTINGYGWDITVNWLNKNLYAQPARSKHFLITAYRTVEIMHLRNRANGIDQWNDERFKDFEKWVFKSLGDLLPPSESQIIDESKSSVIKDSKKAVVSEDDNYILDTGKISKIFKKFNDVIFENMKLVDFLSCFNLSTEPKHPIFKYPNQIKFVYFLVEIGFNERRALERFGIKSFKSQKSRVLKENIPDKVFINQIKSILK